KLVSAPGLDQVNKQMEEMQAYMYMEFKPDGTLTMGADFADPQMKELVEKMAASSGQKISYSWKYKLLSGDGVEFYDMPKELQQKGGGVFGKGESSKVKVTIDGDNMTVTGSDGTGKLTRVK